jgi:hypothetical protein
LTTPYGAPMPSNLPEAPISINFKIPEVPGSPMLTVRGNNGVELSGLSEDVARHGAQIGKALTDFRAGFLAGAGMPVDVSQVPPVVPAQPQQTYQPQNPTVGYGQAAPQYNAPAPQPQQWPNQPQQQYGTPPQTGGQGPAPACPHGQRVFKEGVSQKTGRPYRMWVCPADRGPGQCKPENA